MMDTQPAGAPRWRSALLNGCIAILLAAIGYEAYGVYADATRTPPLPPAHQRDSLRVNGGMQIDILNGCGASGVGQAATEYCRSLGYDVVEMRNYKNFAQERSLVIDRSGKLDEARQLAQRLGIEPGNVLQEISRDYFVTASVVIGKDYGRLRPWNQHTTERGQE